MNDLQKRIDSVLIELQDIGNEINNNALSTEINPQRLDELNNQNNQLFNLKNKHRKSSVKELKDLLILSFFSQKILN